MKRLEKTVEQRYPAITFFYRVSKVFAYIVAGVFILAGVAALIGAFKMPLGFIASIFLVLIGICSYLSIMFAAELVLAIARIEINTNDEIKKIISGRDKDAA